MAAGALVANASTIWIDDDSANLFKVDTVDVRKYDEVKDQIYEELRQQRFQDWFNGQRAALKVTVEDPEGFRQTVAQAH